MTTRVRFFPSRRTWTSAWIPLLGCLAFAGTSQAETLFQQDFSSSGTVASYVSGTPGIGQFNAISNNGTVTVAIVGGTLQFARSGGGSGTFSRSTNFAGTTPTAIMYTFDVSVTGNAAASTGACTFRVGNGFGTANNDEADANTYAKLGISFTATAGSYTIRNIVNATESSVLSGTQTITWVMNNSGGTLTYDQPGGGTTTVSNDNMDVWAGSTLLFNDIPVTTQAGSMTDLKYIFNGGNATVSIDNMEIHSLPVLKLAATHTNVTCNGLTNGAIDLTPSGGFPPYSYSWSNGATTQDLSGIAAGSYTVTVTDARESKPLTVVVTQPPALALSETHTNVACFGASTGAINLTVTGGTSPYTYTWSNAATTEDLSGLVAGTYSVTVKDANNCTANLSIPVTQPSAALNATETHVNVLCNGATTGSVDLTPTGGTPPYTYSWSNGATSQDLSGVASGTYSVTVTDANSCTFNTSATVTQPAALALTETHTNVACFGAANGAINLTVTGGVQPYTYSWSNSATTEDLSGLSGGSYTVTVTDANSCTANTKVSVTEPGSALSLTETHTDVACFGAANGTIDLTVTGGEPPYSYSWSNGATTQDLSGLSGGSYTVTVTDAATCSQNLKVSVTEAPQLVLTETHVDASCFGAADGSINLTVTGGTPPFTYSWTNAAVTEDLSALAAGSYTVTVTDANNCSQNLKVSVGEPAQLTLTETHVDVQCFGANNGSIDLTVTGGTEPYSYSWSNTAATQDLTSLGPGKYAVTVTDAHGCSANTSILVGEPSAALAVTETHTDVACFGATTGAIDITPTGGTPPYTFAWSNSATTEDLSGVGAGKYAVTVTDSRNCTTNLSVTLTEPAAALAIAETHVDATCNGATDGSIDITVTGGTGPYTYSWSNSATSEDLTGLAAGSYTVTVTDSKNCTANLKVPVGEPAVLAIAETHVDATCNAATDGSIDITVTGGTGPYTYSWSNAATSEDLTGLAAGSYTVTVTDAHNCSANLKVPVGEPAVLTLSETHTNVACFGAANGTITLTVTGGTGPYTYSWSNAATTKDLTDLAGGKYAVTVTDAHNCTAGLSVTLTEPSSALSITETHTDVTCFGAANGAIDITVTGGTPPYTYSWDNAATTEDLTGLSGGKHAVTVTDAAGCVGNLSVTLVEPASAITITETHVDATCNGITDGSIDITVTGGTAPYTYSWSNAATSEDLSGLGAGSYTVTVTDSKSCTQNLKVSVTEPAVLTLAETHADVSCFGQADGSITLTVTGGTGPYSYSWSNAATTKDLTDLSANKYAVTVTDAHGCTAGLSVTITAPSAALAITEGHTDVACFGSTTGAIDITVTGGTPPFSFNWSNGATTEDLTGLVGGKYAVTVTDAHNCTASMSITLTEPASGVTITETHADATCNGATDGSIDITVTGGTGPYTFAWSNSATTEDLTGLAAGSYTVTVTDATNCSQNMKVVVAEPAALALTETHADVGCFGETNGSIDLTVTGGTGPYTYSWSNSATTQDLTDLSGGKYAVTVTDAHNCTANTSITIAAPTAALAITETHTNVACFGANNGAIDITVTGGTGPYTYSWSNSATTEDLTGLSGGKYLVNVTDAHNCSASLSVTLDEPASAMVLSETHTNANCHGDANGTIDLTVTGGTGPYSYSWSNGATTANVTGLAAAKYVATVTDAGGCSGNLSVTIDEPVVLAASGVVTDENRTGTVDGAINLTVTGGTGPYTYAWSNAATTEDLTGLAAGAYDVTVTDAHGCTAGGSFSVAVGHFVIVSSAGPGGSVTPTDSTVVGRGADAKIGIAANPGFSIATLLVDGSPVTVTTSYTFTNVQANHTLAATFTDNIPPAVAVTAPNGGEDWEVGQSHDITWTATDANGVASVDISVSRDLGATWTVVASGIANTGTYTWTVVPPGTNTGVDPVFNALAKVVAHDTNGNAGSDSSDAGFSVYDRSVETLVAQFEAEPTDQGVTLRWQFGATSQIGAVSVERSETNLGPWVGVDAQQHADGGATVAVDLTAQGGRTYWYRLVTQVHGHQIVFGPISAVAQAPITEFAITQVAPNPGPGPFRVSYALPREASIRLSLVDVTGREVLVLAEGRFQPGRYTAAWDGRSEHGLVQPGIYFLRYQAAGKNSTKRLVISR